MRRRDALAAEPNAAHRALAALELDMGDRFYLCTQNVDDLRERAGSARVTTCMVRFFSRGASRAISPTRTALSTNPVTNV